MPDHTCLRICNGFLGDTVSSQALFPFGSCPNTRSFSTRPTSYITNRSIAKNISHFLRVTCCPLIDKQASTTDTLQRRTLGQSHMFENGLVEFIPHLDRPRAAEHTRNVNITDVESTLQQLDVDFGMVIGKTGSPDPRLASGRLCRRDEIGCLLTDLKMISSKPVPTIFPLVPGLWLERDNMRYEKTQEATHQMD